MAYIDGIPTEAAPDKAAELLANGGDFVLVADGEIIEDFAPVPLAAGDLASNPEKIVIIPQIEAELPEADYGQYRVTHAVVRVGGEPIVAMPQIGGASLGGTARFTIPACALFFNIAGA